MFDTSIGLWVLDICLCLDFLVGWSGIIPGLVYCRLGLVWTVTLRV